MRFDPRQGGLTCGTCGGHQAQPEPGVLAQEQAVAEHDYAAALAQRAGSEPAIEPVVVDCPQCGARTHFDPHVIAGTCAFCTAPLHSAYAHAERLIRPQAVLPFRLDEAMARRAFRAWIDSRWFAPNALREAVRQPEGLRGVYLPAWSFDARSDTVYAGDRGTRRVVVESGTDGQGRVVTKQRTVVDWARVRGTVRADFDDVVVAASASLPAQREAVLGTVPVPLLQPYDPALLAGFGVEVYQVGLEAAFDAARDRVMLPGIREAVRRDIGGDEQRIVQISPRFSEIRFRHLLLPVWLLHYRWGDQLKQVVVNGHSGAVVGDRPWSWWKVGSAVALALGSLALLAWWLMQPA
ncbi:MAG: hypothetical protein ACK5W4_07265 [Inhella sp.]|uniref:hypothetical protein n=1 Tax=Inhella sp. TaxID=1921806 RepID=UPI00391EFB77